MEIKNLKKAAARIKKAIENKENVILYGDADLDGVTSVIILEESIKTLGGKVSTVYFPDRESEGYGISETGLNAFKKYAPAVLVAVDCGISNFKEVVLAKKFGFEVIIIDHHEILDELPQAQIIVDPKQKDDKYPFKKFAAVGLVFKLAETLLEKNLSENLKRNFLELVALATVADSMPREGENELFIGEGFSTLANSWRPGLKAFLENKEIGGHSNLYQKVSKIISILNVRDIENRLPVSFRLLNSGDLAEAKEMVAELLEKNKIKKEKIATIQDEIEARIARKKEPIIFEAAADFELILLGGIASILCQKYSKPVFLMKQMKEESHGTIRTPSEINSVDLLKHCSKYLLTFGGHPQASGFRIKNENLEKFRQCLLTNLKR